MLDLFKDISISLKLAIGSAVTLLLTVVMALAGWHGVQTLVEKIQASQSLSNTLTSMNDASRSKAVYIAQPTDASAREVLALLGDIQKGLSDNGGMAEIQQVNVARSAVDQFSSSFSGLVSAQNAIEKHDAEIAEARVAIRNVGDKAADSARIEEAKLHQDAAKQQQLVHRANQLALKIGDVVELSLRAQISLAAGGSATGKESAVGQLEAVRRITEELFDSSVAPEVDKAAEALKAQIGKTLQMIGGLGAGDESAIAGATDAIQATIDRAKALKEAFFRFIEQSNTETNAIEREALKARAKANLGAKFAREAMEVASELGDYHAEPTADRQKTIEKRLVSLKNLSGAVKGMTGLDASATLETLNKAFAGLVAAQKSLRDNLAAAGNSEALVSRTLNDLVKENKTEANAIANRAAITILVATFISLAFAIVITLGLWLLISRPLKAFTQTTLRVAKGDHNVDLDAAGRKDEIGQLISAMAVFRDSLIENQRLEAKQRQAQLAQNERQRKIDALIASFRDEMGNVLQAVGQNVEELRSTAKSMAALAEGNAQRSASVADASRNASSNVGAVAAASEELTGSIEEISRQASEAMTTVKAAAGTAAEANTKVTGLAEAAQTIGEVISLISDIAGQTNLLALNATIEAARAGEAGKGFAVVASEVKNLATQTSKATERISAQVAGIQSETTETVKTIGLITKTMEEVNQYTNAIAAAVSQQGSTTGEISRNILEAAERTRSVAETAGETTTSSIQTKSAAEQVLTASSNVHDKAMALKNRIDHFLEKVAAA